MSDQEFFRKLDLSRPELASVRTAVENGDYPAAKCSLRTYFKSRAGTYYTFPPQTPGKGTPSWKQFLPIANDLVHRTGVFAPKFWKGNSYDWKASSVESKERMYVFGYLGKAYAVSGDEEIAKAWVNLLRGYVEFCPKSQGGSWWASMHVGIRMRTGWPEALQCFINSPSLSDDDVALFLKSVWEQTDFVRYNSDATSNWLTFSMAGLYASGAMFPEFRDAAGWRKHARETATQDMDVGWLPDGMSIELTPGYGQFFSNYFFIYDLAKTIGRCDEFNLREFYAKTQRPYELYMKVMAPDRTAPATNDNAPVDVPWILRQALTRFSDREDFRWIVSDGKEGVEPAFTSVLLPYAGFAAMRSGWSRHANMLYFDGGPVGYRHAHQDKLEVILWAYGRQILFDPGRTHYSDSREQNYCMDTFSHNTVLVDNRPQRRNWYTHPSPGDKPYQKLADIDWQSTATFDDASGVYNEDYGRPGESDAYPFKKGGSFKTGWAKPATHHRRVLFLKPDVYAIADTLIPNDDDTHRYDVRWHLDTTSTTEVAQTHAVQTVDDGKPNLEIVPLRTDGLELSKASAQRQPELLGWKVADALQPATTLRHVKTAQGTIQFVTLLLPLKRGVHAMFGNAAPHDGESWQVHLSDGRAFSLHVPSDTSVQMQASWMN